MHAVVSALGPCCARGFMPVPEEGCGLDEGCGDWWDPASGTHTPSLQQGKSSSTGNLLDKDDLALPPPDYGTSSRAFPGQTAGTFKQRPYSVAVPAFSQVRTQEDWEATDQWSGVPVPPPLTSAQPVHQSLCRGWPWLRVPGLIPAVLDVLSSWWGLSTKVDNTLLPRGPLSTDWWAGVGSFFS